MTHTEKVRLITKIRLIPLHSKNVTENYQVILHIFNKFQNN